MTTPGGVLSLPHAALTLDTIASKLQDMSGTAMKNRAVERFPSIFNNSTGLNPALDITPFGILTRVWAEANSVIANADPNDIQTPDDIPELLLEFIEGLPLVGQFVDLLEAITGTYDGDDPTLLIVQEIFGPIRALVEAFSDFDLSEPGAILARFGELLSSWKIMPWQWGDGIPLGLVSTAPRSLVAVGNFPNAASISGSDIWTFDETVTSTDDGTGSARTTADGTLKVLRSVQFPVTEGVEVPVRGRFRWRDLVSTGVPLKLGVREFHTDGSITDDAVAEIAAPGSNSASGGHMDFVQLNATYDPPAGVERVWLRAIVEPTATAGTVWFDDGDADTTDEAPDWLAWLPALFGLPSLSEAINGDIDDIIAGFISGKLNPLNLLEDNGIRDFVKGMIDQLASILRVIPFVGDDLAESLSEFADNMEAQNDVVIGTAASLSQLAAAMGAGTPDADDFERTTLGPNWRVITSSGGSVTCNGHDLVMSHNADTDYIVLKTDKTASSDYQTVEFTLGSAPDWGTVLVDTARAHNDGWVRCSNFTTWATRTGIRIRWSAQNQNVEISAWVNGSKVATIFNDALQSASAGSRLKLEAGVLGVPRQYIIRINDSIVKDVVESGTASQLGSGFRHRGCGGRTEKLGIDPFAISPDPGRLKAWTATG